MPKVSVIILTYNSSAYISELIKSIKEFNPDGSSFEIIVVDNLSTDDTLVKLKPFESEITIKKNEKNLGFAGGINEGAKIAKGDYLLFINPDTQFKKGNIWDMISVFEKFGNAGVVGGKLTDKNGNAEKSAGRFFGLFEILLMTLGLDEVFGVRFSPNKITSVDFVSGGFMMVKKEVFKKLNGFDENFFMYVEDVDFCKRASENGYKTYFTPDVSLIHSSHGSSNRSFAIENIYKGIFYYTKKHGNILSVVLVKLMLKFKAVLIVIIAKILNNNNLRDTYKKAMKV